MPQARRATSVPDLPIASSQVFRSSAEATSARAAATFASIVRWLANRVAATTLASYPFASSTLALVPLAAASWFTFASALASPTSSFSSPKRLSSFASRRWLSNRPPMLVM